MEIMVYKDITCVLEVSIVGIGFAFDPEIGVWWLRDRIKSTG